MTMLTIDMSLIRMLSEGPEVSLNGSPTVSPTIEWLDTSEHSKSVSCKESYKSSSPWAFILEKRKGTLRENSEMMRPKWLFDLVVSVR